jgi:hypothetical protein
MPQIIFNILLPGDIFKLKTASVFALRPLVFTFVTLLWAVSHCYQILAWQMLP